MINFSQLFLNASIDTGKIQPTCIWDRKSMIASSRGLAVYHSITWYLRIFHGWLVTNDGWSWPGSLTSPFRMISGSKKFLVQRFQLRIWPRRTIWVCLKIGYIPNYSHLIGIMISKTIGFRGTLFSDTPISFSYLCYKRREFSGMIHWLTIKFIIPTPGDLSSNPTFSTHRISKTISFFEMERGFRTLVMRMVSPRQRRS